MTDYKYDITIISISYNNFDNLEKHLESIKNQKYDSYELIFQDDGSKNYDEKKIMNLLSSDFIEKHNVKFYHNDTNVGTVKNINIGVAKSHGKIIMPIAIDDCLAHDNVIATFMKEFEDDDCNVCTCVCMQEKSKIIGPCQRDIELTVNGSQRDLLDRLYASNCISGALLTIRKSFFEKKQLFDERFILVEDYPTALKLVKEGERIRVIREVCLIHGEDGISNRFSTLFNKNKTLTHDAKLIKDIFVMPYLDEVNNRCIRRFIKACYILRYHKNKIQLLASLLKYSDIWLKVLIYYLFHFKNGDGVYYYLKRN